MKKKLCLSSILNNCVRRQKGGGQGCLKFDEGSTDKKRIYRQIANSLKIEVKPKYAVDCDNKEALLYHKALADTRE